MRVNLLLPSGRWARGSLAAAMFAVATPAAYADALLVSNLSGSGTVRADFNGDGFDDLAIGAPSTATIAMTWQWVCRWRMSIC
jgi:hypothetical protein